MKWPSHGSYLYHICLGKQNNLPKRDNIVHIVCLLYFRRPGEEILDIVYSLMEYGQDRDEPEFMLATTAVAHTFCRNHVKCYKSTNIQRIVTFLESNLQRHLDRIGENSADQDKVIVDSIIY